MKSNFLGAHKIFLCVARLHLTVSLSVFTPLGETAAVVSLFQYWITDILPVSDEKKAELPAALAWRPESFSPRDNLQEFHFSIVFHLWFCIKALHHHQSFCATGLCAAMWNTFPRGFFFLKILAFCLIGSLCVWEATVRKQSQLIPIGSDPPATLGTQWLSTALLLISLFVAVQTNPAFFFLSPPLVLTRASPSCRTRL